MFGCVWSDQRQGDELTYSVKEIFLTLQGEGANTGRTAVFCRFSGCNLWTGLEKDRITAKCKFCDTDFVGTDGVFGGKYPSAESLIDAVENLWPTRDDEPFVVFTGGEPLLQLDEELISVAKRRRMFIAIETNGTIGCPAGVDWICVSPKSGSTLKQKFGHELKVVFPQIGQNLAKFESLDFEHFFLQPMDGPNLRHNVTQTVDYCKKNPQWRLSVQTHKVLGIP